MCELISRRAAIDAVCEYCEYFYNEKVIQSIKEIPSVQPQRMRGRWLEVRDYEGERIKITHTECSACHQGGNDKWNYCPNCGADMRETE